MMFLGDPEKYSCSQYKELISTRLKNSSSRKRKRKRKRNPKKNVSGRKYTENEL